MLTAVIGTVGSEKKAVLIGLSFGDLQKFLAEPGDIYVEIKKERIGTEFDIVIFSGETEDHLRGTVMQLAGSRKAADS